MLILNLTPSFWSTTCVYCCSVCHIKCVCSCSTFPKAHKWHPVLPPPTSQGCSFVFGAHRCTCDLQVSCYRCVTICSHFPRHACFSPVVFAKGVSVTVARHSSLHFHPHVQASVCCLSFVGSEQQTCRCSWQLWASHGLFWKQFVGALARPCDQVKKRGRWREAAVILTLRPGSKKRGRQMGSLTFLRFRACGQWHSEMV